MAARSKNSTCRPAQSLNDRVRAAPQTFNPIYKAYELFLRTLLRDDSVRTQDPYEANLFYVPALTCVCFSLVAQRMMLRLSISRPGSVSAPTCL